MTGPRCRRFSGALRFSFRPIGHDCGVDVNEARDNRSGSDPATRPGALTMGASADAFSTELLCPVPDHG